MKTTIGIFLVLAMAFVAVPMSTPAAHAECSVTLGSPCPVERPATICSKVLNTVVQPVGAVQDIFTGQPANILARAIGIAVNAATLPGNIVANIPCGCEAGVVDHAPGVTPVCGIALACPSCS